MGNKWNNKSFDRMKHYALSIKNAFWQKKNEAVTLYQFRSINAIIVITLRRRSSLDANGRYDF